MVLLIMIGVRVLRLGQRPSPWIAIPSVCVGDISATFIPVEEEEMEGGLRG